MKTPLLLCALTAFTATGAAWWWLRPPPAMAAAIPAPPPPPGHLTTVEDKAAVFQRAFWRQAAAEDSVLHAERREWSDPTGHITHWQWFLAVEPGPALRTWLLETNPFSLQPAPGPLTFSVPAPAPDWFPGGASADTWELHQAAGGKMTLLFSRSQNLLYATASGAGLQKPAL